MLGPVVGSIDLLGAARPDLTACCSEAVRRGVITVHGTANQVGPVRFMLVGLGLMLLLIFRPQGIFGDKREIALDAR